MPEVLDDIVSFHKNPKSRDPLVLGEVISWEEAEARSPLNEDERSKWVARQENSKKIQSRLHGNLVHLIENPHLPETQTNVIDLLIGDDQRLLENLRKEEDEDFGEIPINLVQMLSNDSNKLWESGLKGFEESGEYNQISLSDSGKLIITIIKPGVMESLRAEVGPQFEEPIRQYIKKYTLDWDNTGEGFKNDYTGLGGMYQFVRAIPLLREGNGGHNIDLIWRGQHTNPVIEGGPFAINDIAEISVQPVSYSGTE